MKVVTTFIRCFLYIIWCTLSKAQRYTVNHSLDNKVSTIGLLGEHPSISVTECTIKCGELCACFGFNRQLCRIHQTCDPADMTNNEAGWVYFSPTKGNTMLYYRFYIKCYAYYCIFKGLFCSFVFFTYMWITMIKSSQIVAIAESWQLHLFDNVRCHLFSRLVPISHNSIRTVQTKKGPKCREPRSFKCRQNFVSIMDSVEEYARGWTKSEGEEPDTLSEWIKSIRKLLKSRIHHLSVKCALFILLSLRNQKG
jgi:hypothetical protein